MNNELYFRLIQHIDALFEDGKLTREDLIRLSAYAIELGESRRVKTPSKEEKTDRRRSPLSPDSDINEIVSDVLARTYR